MATTTVAAPSTWTAGRRKRDGKRFFYIPGSAAGTVYMTAVDGCTCPAAQHSRDGDCKHQQQVRRVMAPPTIRIHRARFDDLYPACRQCGDLADGPTGSLCFECCSAEVRRLDQERKRAMVASR